MSEKIQTLLEEQENIIAELKSTRSSLKDREKMAILGEMSAAISHEISNPVTVLLGSFIQMESEVENLENEKIKKGFHRLGKGIRKLSEFVFPIRRVGVAPKSVTFLPTP